MHRENVKIESEFEKERALMEQKIVYLEKSLDEKTSKEKDYMQKWNLNWPCQVVNIYKFNFSVFRNFNSFLKLFRNKLNFEKLLREVKA